VPQANATWGHKDSNANYSTLFDGSNFNDCASGFFIDTNIPDDTFDNIMAIAAVPVVAGTQPTINVDDIDDDDIPDLVDTPVYSHVDEYTSSNEVNDNEIVHHDDEDIHNNDVHQEHKEADANIVEIDYASNMRVQSSPIPADDRNPRFNRLLDQPLVLDAGSKPTVFRLMPTFTHYASCRLTLTLRHTEQEITGSQLEVHGVGHVGGLKRCLHVPESSHNLLSMSHYLKYYPKSLFICTNRSAYLLQTPNVVRTDVDLFEMVMMSRIVARFYFKCGLYVSHHNDFLYQRESDVPDTPYSYQDIAAVQEEDGPIINMMQSEGHVEEHTADMTLRDVLDAIASLDMSKKPTRFMDVHEDIKDLCMTADGSIEVLLKRGDSRILIDPTHTLYAKLKAIIDSGASICMFNQHRYFKDMVEDNSTIRTAGKAIKAHGRGTVGYLQNCLYVPELQRNLISVSHVCQEMQGFFAFFSDRCIFVQPSTGQILCDYPLSDGLYSTLDLAWLGINLLDIDVPVSMTPQRAHDISTYIAGVIEDAYHVQEELLQNEQRS
jgi:hypothetical protein